MTKNKSDYRLRVPDETYELIPESLLFGDNMDQFFFFMSLGFRYNLREPLPKSKKKDMVLEYRIKGDPERENLLYVLTLYHYNKDYFENESGVSDEENNFKIILDKDTRYTIAEEYAYGGMLKLIQLNKNSSLEDKNIIEREILRYLKKIDNE